jgi:signal transduction histidine kinase/HAMP domain-containing protein
MTFELSGIAQAFELGLPLRLIGYLVMLGSAAATAGLLISWRDRHRAAPPQGAGFNHHRLLAALLVVAPLLAQLGLVTLKSPATSVSPGIPLNPTEPAFSILGALPWLLAAGFLGPWQAALVGLMSGLARGGWWTHSAMTPLSMALEAALVAWLLRRPYAERIGAAIRHPLVAGLLGGGAFGVLRVIEVFCHTSGYLYDGLDFALNRAPLTMAAALLEAGLAGALAEVARGLWREYWHQPARLTAGPYNRSLAARMVAVFALLGMIASASLLYGDWLLARAAAADLVEQQMSQTAAQAGGSVPYFIQSGRSLGLSLADSLAPSVSQGKANADDLQSRLRIVPFFSRLTIFDSQRHVMAFTAQNAGSESLPPQDLGPALSIALSGVPQEVVVPPLAGSQGAQLVFLTPITNQADGVVLGALAGWTDLGSNPILQPVVARLSEVTPGDAMLIDQHGRALIMPGGSRLLETFDFSSVPPGVPRSDLAPDGTRRLIYRYAIEGYPWQVVITTPQHVVDRLALTIAVRLFGVMALVGVLAIVGAYVLSRQLTRPLTVMAGVAESIARGNLDQPVPFTGQDEIGRLAESFMRMQNSLRGRLEDMALLLKVSQRMASSFELEQVMPPILQGVQALTGADLVRLVLKPPEGEGAEAGDGYQQGEDPGNWSALDQQVLDLCQGRGRIVLENPARARAVLSLQPLTTPIEGLMALPLKNEEAFVGALWLGHRQPHAFSSDEINLLSILAGQLGASVANSRLYHQAEQERLRLGTVLEATPDAVIVIDRRGRISLANPAAEVVMRGPADQARLKPAQEWLTSPELVELLLGNDEEVGSAEVKTADGRVLFASACDIEGQNRAHAGRVCVLADITHYKKLDMLKTEFVSTVSHDLRAPLTLMRGYGTMLAMVGELNEQQEEFAQKILKSVDQMAHLVDNLLDLGRIEAGVGLSLESVRLDEVIEEVAASYRPQAANKQIDLQVEIEGTPEAIEADPTLLRQAIANLLDNALKYTAARGKVLIRLRQEGEGQAISVQDSGMGIAPADQARLFEKFFRARRRESLKEKGSGLGLAIVKSIAEQHGGRVTVESRLGAGSTFVLEVPAHPKSADSSLDSQDS